LLLLALIIARFHPNSAVYYSSSIVDRKWMKKKGSKRTQTPFFPRSPAKLSTSVSPLKLILFQSTFLTC